MFIIIPMISFSLKNTEQNPGKNCLEIVIKKILCICFLNYLLKFVTYSFSIILELTIGFRASESARSDFQSALQSLINPKSPQKLMYSLQIVDSIWQNKVRIVKGIFHRTFLCNLVSKLL
ncbi:UNVERIFIED_CONTAM: hypothetical protein NCL1_14500 [Trichonephila clavipes]